MKDYDTLDQLLNMLHALKVEFIDSELRDHVVDMGKRKAKDDPEKYSIFYFAEIHKKALIDYALFDRQLVLKYHKDSIEFIPKYLN